MMSAPAKRRGICCSKPSISDLPSGRGKGAPLSVERCLTETDPMDGRTGMRGPPPQVRHSGEYKATSSKSGNSSVWRGEGCPALLQIALRADFLILRLFQAA